MSENNSDYPLFSFERSEADDQERTWISKESKEDLDEVNVKEIKKILLDKKLEVAPQRSLGGSQIVKENGVNVSKSILMWCDVCGDKVELEGSVICRIDSKKVCQRCVVFDGQRKVCFDCYKSIHPLSKQEYKVLFLKTMRVKKGLFHNLTKIKNSDIKKAEKFLRSAGYLMRKLWTDEVTDRGLEILGRYRKIFQNEEDVVSLERSLTGKYVL
jgi:hypothetical protein